MRPSPKKTRKTKIQSAKRQHNPCISSSRPTGWTNWNKTRSRVWRQNKTRSKASKRPMRTKSIMLMSQRSYKIRGNPVRPLLWSLKRISAKTSSKANNHCSKPSKKKEKQHSIVTKISQSLSQTIIIRPKIRWSCSKKYLVTIRRRKGSHPAKWSRNHSKTLSSSNNKAQLLQKIVWKNNLLIRSLKRHKKKRDQMALSSIISERTLKK